MQAVRERFGLPERFLLYVGSVEPRKNLPSALEALAALKEGGRPESFVIAGRGEPKYLAHIRSVMRQTGLEEGRDVHLIGPVAEGDLAALYSLCVLFVYPSLYEGFGLPPLEAMACGAPVLLANNSSLSELFETSSAFVDLDRPDGLLRAIETLLDSAELLVPSLRALVAPGAFSVCPTSMMTRNAAARLQPSAGWGSAYAVRAAAQANVAATSHPMTRSHSIMLILFAAL